MRCSVPSRSSRKGRLDEAATGRRDRAGRPGHSPGRVFGPRHDSHPAAAVRRGSPAAPGGDPAGASPVGAHLSLAELYTLRRDTERAVPLYRRVVELDAGNVPARLALAQVEIERGRPRAGAEARRARPGCVQGLARRPARPRMRRCRRTGNREALSALARDWLRLTDVPQEWSLAFATRLAGGGAADEALAVLERVRSRARRPTNWRSTSPASI